MRAKATIRQTDDGIHVDVVWTGVELDRPSTCGFSLRSTHLRLARRLKAAIDDQAAHVNPTVLKDVYEKTYVNATCLVSGRCMNADLRRLGY